MEGKGLYVTAWFTSTVVIQIYDGYTNVEEVEHKSIFILKNI